MTTFKSAIVRLPAHNFADGLTTSHLGRPDFDLALAQHAHYCQALEACGLELTRLLAEPRFPDSSFVEDAAILVGNCAILTNPGAPSRSGEVALLTPILEAFFSHRYSIAPPGYLDGGDVCQAGDQFFIGISERTNLQGAAQLIEYLRLEGFNAYTIDIRAIPGLLHLKSGLAFLGGNDLVLSGPLSDHPAFAGFHCIPVDPAEIYAANCVRINDFVLLPAGFPVLQARLESQGYHLILLEMSEFQKMDGGLSCLSLRF